MEVIAKELQVGWQWELLCADDLIFMVMSKVEICRKIVKWKVGHRVKRIL